MVDVIHSPLSPAIALTAIDQYVRVSHQSELPSALRARGFVDLTLTSTPDGFRVRLNRPKRGGIECIGHFAATPSGSILTYEIVERSSRRGGTIVVVGAIWLGVLLYLRLPPQQTVSLLAVAAITIVLSVFLTPAGSASALRVAVYEMLSSALEGSDLHAST